MPPIASGVFEALLPKAVELGLSANATLQTFRALGYQKQTQAFFNLYRQARAAALNVPEIQILGSNAKIPQNLFVTGSPYQSHVYQYRVSYPMRTGAPGRPKTGYLTIGSSEPLFKGDIIDQAYDLTRDKYSFENVSLDDLTITRASVRGEL